jgi:hypothetical protein
MKTFQTSSLLAALCYCILGMVGKASAVPVALQQHTATFSQTFSGDFSVSKAIDGTTADNLGWAIAQGAATDLPAQTAVFEMVTNVGFTGGSRLTFTFLQTHDFDFVYHTLGRFRISVTTDDRSLFADGLPAGGDVTANWTVLNPDTIVSSNGGTLTKLGDLSVLASGTSPYQDIYTISAATTLTDITGIRIEAMKDASLPFGGPGRQPLNGNFVLSELLVSITPETSDPPVVNCTTAPSGLVSWWPGEQTAADVVSSNSFTLGGNTTFSEGRVGSGFSFDGDRDGVNLGNPAGLRLQNFTIEAWIKRGSATICSLDQVQGPGGVMLSYGFGGYGFGVFDSGELFLTEIGLTYVDSPLFVTDTNYHHVAVTKSGGAVTFYLDGVAAPVANYNPTFQFVTEASIGAVSADRRNNFLGRVDELAVYNRSLTPEEIQAIVAAGAGGKCPPPPSPPTITQHPANQTINANDTAQFAVTATGLQALRYQWFIADNPLPSQTNSTLSIANALPINQGVYRVAVSNDIGFAISSNATLTVLTFPPVITRQPTNVTAIESTAASFSLQATGSVTRSVTLAYQWLFNGAPLAGKTTTTLSFTSVQLSNAGNYSVIVTNPYGAVTSSVATLTVNPRPPCVAVHDGLVSWWKGERNASDSWGDNHGNTPFGLTTTVFGKVGAAFDYGRSGISVVVNDSPSLRPTNAITLEAWVKITTIAGSSAKIFVSKFDSPVVSPDGMQSSYMLGTTNYGLLFFTISGSGSARTNITLVSTNALPTNQWSHIAATYDGAAMRLYIDGAQAAQTNYSGGIFSGSANVGIGGIPQGTAFNWPFFGTLDEVSIYNRALSAAEIQSIVAADLTGKCLAPPVITQQPQDQTVPQGEDVKFSVEVSGSRPLSYQWYFNGGAPQNRIIGATNAALIIEKVRTNNVGFYFVTVTNSVGSNFSATAKLETQPAPSCVDVLPGLISWWSGDTNTLDGMALNNISLYSPTSYPTGKVASAFTFNGVNSRITVNNSASLNFTTNQNFSIEMWIKAANTNSTNPNVPLFEKFDGFRGYSLSLYNGRLAFALGGQTASGDTSSRLFISAGVDLRDAFFHHVAVTVDRTNSNGGVLYVDGALVLVFDPRTYTNSLLNQFPLYIGGPFTTGTNSYFNGLIDEPAIYGRALSAEEILSIRNSGAAGRCRSKPVIVTQPVGRSAYVGESIVLSVVATGNPSPRYQWRRNNIVLAGQTSSTLSLTNVSFVNAGTYSVVVSNGFGSVTSSNASLSVYRLPSAESGSFEVNEDASADVVLNGTNPNGNERTYSIITPPTNGILTGSALSQFRTYVPASNYNGPDSFTFIVHDGPYDSAPATMNITVRPVDDAPTAVSQELSTDEDAPLNITLQGGDVDGDKLAFEIVQQPVHGVLTGNNLSGPKWTYTPAQNYFGSDYFTFVTRDPSNSVSQLAAVVIAIRPVNDAPVARIVITPLDQLPGETNTVLISPACCDTTLVLDGSQSSDVENVPLTYIWMDGTNVIGTTATFTNRFAPGVHEFALIVSDGELTGTELLTVEILKTEEAVLHLQTLVQASSLARNEKASLINWLRVTIKALERCEVDQAVKFLERFEGRVAERISVISAKDAERWLTISQAIREVAGLCETTDRPRHDKDEDDDKDKDKDKPKHDKSDDEKSDRDRSGSGNSKVEKATAKAGQENRGDRGNSDDVRAAKSSLR